MDDLYVTVDGLAIRYRDTGGAGLPVVLSHGIAGSLDLWAPQMTQLGKTHRLVAWDAPNHGLSGLTGDAQDFDSYAGWLLRFADAIGLGQFIAAGNSMGGAVSLRAAGLAPQRIRGLVLANAASLGKEVFPVFRLMTLPLLGEVMNKPSPQSVDRALFAIVKDKSCIDETLREAMVRNQFKEGGAAAFLATLRACTTVRGQRASVWQNSLRLLATLATPMLILHGRQDAVLPLKHSEQAATLAQNAQLVVVEDCGHTPQIEKPDAFNQVLADFVAKLA